MALWTFFWVDLTGFLGFDGIFWNGFFGDFYDWTVLPLFG
jgi:hypothetical protein